jgi:hypothetical protein
MHSNVQTLLVILEDKDAKVNEAAKLRAKLLQEIQAEETVALADYKRLASAFDRGEIIKERRTVDKDGKKTVERVPDDRLVVAAKNRLGIIRKRKALIPPVDSSARLSAPRARMELQKFAGKELLEVELPELPLKKSETPEDALPRFTQSSLDIIAEIAAIEKSPRTFAEVESQAHREIDRIADSGIPKTLAMYTSASPSIAWPTHEIAAADYHKVPDGLALVAYMMRDKLKAEISRLLKINASAFSNAMSLAEKTERLAALREELEKAERIEAACVLRIFSEGGTATFRPDISILAACSLRVA